MIIIIQIILNYVFKRCGHNFIFISLGVLLGMGVEEAEPLLLFGPISNWAVTGLATTGEILGSKIEINFSIAILLLLF